MRYGLVMGLAAWAMVCVLVQAQEEGKGADGALPVVGPGYDNTPMIPGQSWRVHDNRRPQPPVVVPAPAGAPVAPPSDAIVLFDGTNLDAWLGPKNKPAGWRVKDGYMEVAPKSGSIRTKDSFGSCQLHLEFATPPAKGTGQGRGNSGVFLMGMYEIQILDSYENVTYADGQCAALYGQHPPLVNACRPPQQWQTYDIVFRAPVFEEGKLVSPGYVTVFQNGILVHDHREILGRSSHKTAPRYRPHGPTGPLSLQDHKNPMRFRNIWIRPLD